MLYEPLTEETCARMLMIRANQQCFAAYLAMRNAPGYGTKDENGGLRESWDRTRFAAARATRVWRHTRQHNQECDHDYRTDENAYAHCTQCGTWHSEIHDWARDRFVEIKAAVTAAYPSIKWKFVIESTSHVFSCRIIITPISDNGRPQYAKSRMFHSEFDPAVIVQAFRLTVLNIWYGRSVDRYFDHLPAPIPLGSCLTDYARTTGGTYCKIVLRAGKIKTQDLDVYGNFGPCYYTDPGVMVHPLTYEQYRHFARLNRVYQHMLTR